MENGKLFRTTLRETPALVGGRTCLDPPPTILKMDTSHSVGHLACRQVSSCWILTMTPTKFYFYLRTAAMATVVSQHVRHLGHHLEIWLIDVLEHQLFHCSSFLRDGRFSSTDLECKILYLKKFNPRTN